MSQHPDDKLKTFRAASMAKALADVKRDLGPDAVIVRTRALGARGVPGTRRGEVVEVMACRADPDAASPRAAQRQDGVGAQTGRDAGVRTRGIGAARAYSAGRAAGGDEANSPDGTVESTRRDPETRVMRVRSSQSEQARDARPVETHPSPAVPTLEQVHAELAAMRRVVAESMVAPTAVGALPDAFAGEYLHLVEAGVSRDLAGRVIADAMSRISAAERHEQGVAGSTVHAALADQLQRGVSDDAIGDMCPRTILLIGPPGAGKTTTAMQLAAALRLREGRRIGVINCDAQRVGASEQLRSFAGILGLAFRAANGPDEVRGALEAMRDQDQVIIDTAGLRAGAAQSEAEVRELIGAAEPQRVLGVIAADASGASVSRHLETQRALGAAGTVLTRAVPTPGFGAVYGALVDSAASIEWIGAGPAIPDDLSPGDARRVASMVIARQDNAGEPESAGATR